MPKPPRTHMGSNDSTVIEKDLHRRTQCVVLSLHALLRDAQNPKLSFHARKRLDWTADCLQTAIDALCRPNPAAPQPRNEFDHIGAEVKRLEEELGFHK